MADLVRSVLRIFPPLVPHVVAAKAAIGVCECHATNLIGISEKASVRIVTIS